MPAAPPTFPEISLEEYLREAQPTDLLITGSNRLARELRLRLGARGTALLPRVLPYGAWLKDCWQRLRFEAALRDEDALASGTLLSPSQEEVVWDRVLREHGAAERLLFLDATVAACIRSEELVREYRLPLEDPAWQRSEESRLYLEWLGDVERICRQEGWRLGATLPVLLAERVADLGYPPGQRIFLAGFEEPTPGQWALFAAFAEHGAQVRILEQPTASQAVGIIIAAAGDAESEWRAAAAWAAEQMAREPDGRFAVVIPDLAANRARIEQIFDDALHPGSSWAFTEPGERRFSISYAPPLAENRVAQAGPRLLGVLREAPSIDELRYLLRCPWLAGAVEEREARAVFEGWLLGLRLDRVPVELLFEGPPRWRAVIARLAECLEDLKARPTRPPSSWAAMVRSLWAQCLWLGQPVLTSEEYQARHRALEELGAMSEIDRVLPSCSWSEFLLRLRRRFDRERFQPESPAAPVLVAGLYEVTGLSFDAAWICGMNDDVLPRPVEPDPFLPVSLQRAHGVPRSSAGQELAFAQAAFGRLLGLAPRVTFSYSRRKDEEELEPSPLLLDLTAARIEIGAASPAADEAADSAWEELEDWEGGALQPERHRLRGGSRLLADQSACPFRAFVQGRLGSEDPEWEAPLMSPLDQGSVLHRALEVFWRETRSREELAALSPEDLDGRITRCVDEALEGFEVPAGDALAAAQKTAERERLCALLSQWMEEELSRAPFTVDQIERERSIEIGGVPVKLRLDRIDLLDDGSVALIDYKSGTVSPKKWLGERPEEPQLLLYMTTETRPVSTLAFASLKTGNVGWQAYGENTHENFQPRDKGGKPLEPEEWIAFRETATAVVERLKDELRSGFAPVDPRDPSVTCKYCAQQPLCRIGDIRMPGGDETDGDEEDA